MLNPVIKPKDAKAVTKPAPGGGRGKKAADAPKAAAADAPKAAEVAAAAVPGAPLALDAAAAEAFSKARLAVGRVVSVGFVEGSDKLYLCKVQVGPAEERQVITGLRKYVPQAELEGRAVVVILNLKAAKLAGHASEAMILAAEEVGPGEEDRRVKLLTPAAGAAPGSRVLMQGAPPPAAEPPKECKSAPWAAVKERLRVAGGFATFCGTVLASAEGPITAEAADGSSIG